MQLEAESAAGVSELLQPGQGQRHAPALVVSVLHCHQPRHRQVGVISPHLAQSAVTWALELGPRLVITENHLVESAYCLLELSHLR